MYLDPGFGSMLIQIIVAAIAACGAYLLIFRNKISEMFKRRKGAQGASVQEDEGDADK